MTNIKIIKTLYQQFKYLLECNSNKFILYMILKIKCLLKKMIF